MMNTKKQPPVATMILCGLFAAITAICSWINIPIGITPVPINLATLAVLLGGAFLGAKAGAVSQLVYLLLGLIGLPVFHGFTSGVGVLAGPTGGYLIGYVMCALFVGALASKPSRTKNPSGKGLTSSGCSPSDKRKGLALRLALVFCGGFLICYAFGTLWFMVSTHTPLLASLMACVLPFLPGDALKIVLAVMICKKGHTPLVTGRDTL